MVTYSAAPLESATVAIIEPFALKALVDNDGVFNYRLFSALGFSRILASTVKNLGGNDEDINNFFRSVIAAGKNFRENAGLYITDDIVGTLSNGALIAKISVTDDSITEQNDDVPGGVAAFVIPNSSSRNAVLITSGGISSPAFSRNVGVSVLPTDYAFQSLAETLYTLAGITVGEINESPDTNWSGGKNVAITIYRSTETSVRRVYQLIIRKDGETVICKEADAGDDGYISIDKWSDVDADENPISSYVYRAHSKVAALLNEIESGGASLSIVGANDGDTVAPQETVARFNAVYLDAFEARHNEDIFGMDEHPVHPANPEIVAPSWSAEPSAEYSEPAREEEVVVGNIVSPDDIETASDLVEFAEYEVTHSEEPAVSGEVNDPSAETIEPFSLGAEYLINEALPEEPFYEDNLAVPTEEEVLTDAPMPLEDLAAPSAESFDNLQWSEVVTGAVDIPVEDNSETVDHSDFADLSWDEVALTVADDDSGSDGNDKPLRGFLRPS